MRYLLLLLLSICTIVCYATVYMKTDSAGNIFYTDVPSNNSQPVNEVTGNTVSSSQSATPTEPQPAAATSSTTIQTTDAIVAVEANKPYQTFELISPADQETIQNQVVIPVKVAIEPQLQPGDAVQLIVDGSPWGNPEKNTALEIKLLDRGTHQVSARLVAESGTVLKETKTVTIYVHRASSNFNPAKNSNP